MAEVPFVKENLSTLKEIEDHTSEKALHIFTTFVTQAYNYISTRNIRAIDERAYISFKAYIDDLREYIRRGAIYREEKDRLYNQISAIKVGGRVPINFFCENSDVKDFIRINGLENVFWTLRLTLGYDKTHGVVLPVELKDMETCWMFWKDLQWKKVKKGYAVYSPLGLVFKTDDYKILSRAYCVLWHGITFYDRKKSTIFKPYRYMDPSLYNYRPQLEVIVTWRKGSDFSYFASTHVSMELKSSNGEVRSVGQDIFDHIRSTPMRGMFRATSRCSIIKSPDEASFYPKNFRVAKKVIFPLTDIEHDRIVKMVEEDKGNCSHSAALLKGNCVSYMSSLLERALGYKVKADVPGHEILLREFLPTTLDNIAQKIFARVSLLPLPVQRSLFFIPPLSIVIAFIGVWSFCSSYYGHNNHREYPLWEYLFKPWNIRADIPKIFFDVLDKYSDENSIIERNKYSRGWLFD